VDYLSFACHCLIGMVFGLSAISKSRGRVMFDEFVRTTRVLLVAVTFQRQLSYSAVRPMAVAVILTEAAIPPLLMISGSRSFGLGLAMLLLAAFSVGIGAALRRGIRTTCRCFGASSASLNGRHLIRNAMLLIAAATGLLIGSAGHADWAGLSVAAGAAVVMTAVVVRLDEVIDVFTPRSANAGRPSY
jgi:hypothetical protein